MTIDELITVLKEKGISSHQVLDAMRKVPRHYFVSLEQERIAYEDHPIPIGYQQVITQPYLVALMTQELLKAPRLKKVLEIGTGSGYQAAVLAQLVDEVYSIERIKPLYELAKKRLKELNLRNVKLDYADGSKGWSEYAPYDGIIVTAAAAEPPPQLLEQLADNGRMIIPLGARYQQSIYTFIRQGDSYERYALDDVLFVPLLPGKV